MGKNRIDIVVGASPALAARVEAFRSKRAEQARKHVTRTDALRELIEAGLDQLELAAVTPGPEKEPVAAGIKKTAGSAVPRFAQTSVDGD